MEGVEWASSEAFTDHHAIAYFAEHGTLAIPVSWNETVDVDDDGDGFVDRREYTAHSAIWAFQIDVDQAGGGAIEIAGRVDHDGDARRSVRIGDHLITVSNIGIKVHDLHDVEQQVGELYLGSLTIADNFTVQEDSGAAVLDVLANDRAGASSSQIVNVTQPTVGSESVGVVTISDDGHSIVFTPKADFFGTATFKYTIHDAVRGEMHATVTVHVENVADAPVAVADEFDVPADSDAIRLELLANDVNADHRGLSTSLLPMVHTGIVRSSLMFDSSFAIESANNRRLTDTIGVVAINQGLVITNVSEGSHGGTISVELGGGAVLYQPAAGFVGAETFTYKIRTAAGLVATGTVTVNVGFVEEASAMLARPADAPDESSQSPVSQALPNLAALFASDAGANDRNNDASSYREDLPPSATRVVSTPRREFAATSFSTENADAAFGQLLDLADDTSAVADELSVEFASQFE
jgi:hypothetical protein